MTENLSYRIEGDVSSPQSRSPSIAIYMLWGGLALMASLVLVLPMQDIRGILALGYLVQVAAYIALNLSRHRYVLIRLLQPSMLSLIYIGLNFVIGAWAFNSGLIIKGQGVSDYHYWQNIKQTYVVLSLCLLTLYFLSLRDLKLPQSDLHLSGRSDDHKPAIALAVTFLLVCLVASTTLTFSVWSQSKTVVSAVLFYIIFGHNIRYKWVLAALVIGFLATTSAFSKREAIFAIPSICLIALSYHPIEKPTLQRTLIAVVAIAAAVVLILAMSIIRGYGNFSTNSFVDAILYIPQYLDMQNSLGMIMNNFEISSTFLHAHNSISFSLEPGAKLAYGETYIRALLIWPIGDLLGYKPASILDQYTGTLFPAFRVEGGSFVVTSIGEAVWNFGALAPFALILIYFGLDSFFVCLVKLIRSRSAWGTIFALNALQFILYYIRGSGLDILLAYSLFSAFTGLLFAVLLKMLDLDCVGRGTAQRGVRLSLDPTI